jgi:hypothetical protein
MMLPSAFWLLPSAICLLRSCLLRFAVVADRFNGTASEGLFAGGRFIRSFGLFVNKGVTVLVRSPETLRRRIATNIAIDTRRIDIVGAGFVFFNFVVSVWQKMSYVAMVNRFRLLRTWYFEL